MIPAKEKALELIGKFSVEFSEYGIGNVWVFKSAKKQSLISVNETLLSCHDDMDDYYNEVIQELEKL